MFTRKPTKDTAAPPPLPNGGRATTHAVRTAPARPRSGTPSVIGPDLLVTGNLESAGEVQIEGEVQGDVHAGRIVIRAQANVTGDLVADEVVVGGNVQRIDSRQQRDVPIGRAASKATCSTRRWRSSRGPIFEGKSRRSDNPMAAQPAANGSQQSS